MNPIRPPGHATAPGTAIRSVLFALLPYGLLLGGRIVLYLLLESHTGWPVIALLARLFFALLMFAILACFLHRTAAAFAVLLLETLLIQVNNAKMSQTGDPISARDLIEVGQSLALTAYATPAMIATALALLAALLMGWRSRCRDRREWLARLPLALLLPVMVSLLASGNRLAASTVRDGLCRINICQLTWHSHADVAINGIPAHLALSASAIHVPAPGPHHFYDRQSTSPLQPDRPDLLMVLCESCFTTLDTRFRTAMWQLASQGFTPLRLLSPVFGGNTAEAEFEALTGLSSMALPGIEYQKFADRFRFDSATLVRRFADSGYTTISMHNYRGDFWKRERVYPRFGFQESRFIEQMEPRPADDDWRPRDTILYRNALARYARATPGERTFLFLITMHTHGLYAPVDGDLGRQDYLQRMTDAMHALSAFLQDMQALASQRGRPLAVVVFGDHKPALAGALLQAGVLPEGLFSTRDATADRFQFVFEPTPEQWKARAQASAFIRLPDTGAGRRLAQRLDNRPLFCLPAELAALIPGKDDPFWRAVHAICQQAEAALLRPRGDLWEKDFPQAIYAERLF